MRLVIEGESALYKKLFNLTDVMKRSFWIGVQEDFEGNLLKNIKPHSKTGKLERNAYVDIINGGVEGGVRDNGMMVTTKGQKVNYGVFVEFGTKPHIITPSKKKSLRFFIGSKAVFSKSVKHPGYKGDPFLMNAAKETFGNLERIFNTELKDKGIV